MGMGTQNSDKQMVLLKAIRYYGAVARIDTSRVQVNNWVNRRDRVPYRYAAVIAAEAGIKTSHITPYAVKVKANPLAQPWLEQYYIVSLARY